MLIDAHWKHPPQLIVDVESLGVDYIYFGGFVVGLVLARTRCHMWTRQSSILDPAHTCGVPERGRCSKKGRRGGVPMSTLTHWSYCHGNGTTASLLSRAPPSLL